MRPFQTGDVVRRKPGCTRAYSLSHSKTYKVIRVMPNNKIRLDCDFDTYNYPAELFELVTPVASVTLMGIRRDNGIELDDGTLVLLPPNLIPPPYFDISDDDMFVLRVLYYTVNSTRFDKYVMSKHDIDPRSDTYRRLTRLISEMGKPDEVLC